MTSFNPELLRDPEYEGRFYRQLDRIKEIQSRHSFIEYATNRQAFDELVDIYDQNLKAYQAHFQGNKEALQDTRNRISANNENLLPGHYQALLDLLPEMENKLESKSYKVNAEVAPLLEALNKQASRFIADSKQWILALRKMKAQLAEVKNQVWAEQFGDLYSIVLDVEETMRSTSLPGNLPSLDTEEIEKAIAERREAFSTLKQELKGRKKLLAQVSKLENTFLTEADFQVKRKALLKKQNTRRTIVIGVFVSVVAMLAVLGIFGPKYLQQAQEEKRWQETSALDSWKGYQIYLNDFPEGPHTLQAREAMLALDYGNIPNLVLPDGSHFDYLGELDAGIPNGQGVGVFTSGDLDGAKYDGAWVQGVMEGHGNIDYPDDGVYTGDWLGGIRKGTGTHSAANGTTYSGAWDNNQPNGQGNQSFPNGAKYIGNFKDGLPHGEGSFYRGNSSGTGNYGDGFWAANAVYTGKWKNGKREGFGSLRIPGHPTYSGLWTNNKPDGRGALRWSDKSEFKGTWKSGLIDGPGTYKSKFRQEDKGTWKGTPENISLYDSDGKLVKQGKFDNGLFVGK